MDVMYKLLENETSVREIGTISCLLLQDFKFFLLDLSTDNNSLPLLVLLYLFICLCLL